MSFQKSLSEGCSEIWREVPLSQGNFSKWVLTLGNFDGVHEGHRKIIAYIFAQATRFQAGVGIVTFDPHPRELLWPDKSPAKLYSFSKRLDIFKEARVDRVFIIRFSSKVAEMSAEEFIETLLSQISVAGVYVGKDFCFGKNREGDFARLSELLKAKGVEVGALPLYEYGGKVVSSSTIRERLAEGDFNGAAQLLGRRWSMQGEVLHGRRLAGQMGFPTLNIKPEQRLPIRNGVYAVEARIGNDKFAGVANIGLRPTVSDNSELLLEAHLFDFSQNVYGQQAEVFPIQFIRPEMKFSGIEQLQAQIRSDANAARQMLGLI